MFFFSTSVSTDLAGGCLFVFNPSNMNADQKAQQFFHYMFKKYLIADIKQIPNTAL